MKIKTQSKAVLFSQDRSEGARHGKVGRGEEVGIKNKVGMERREIKVFIKHLSLDYPNVQKQVQTWPNTDRDYINLQSTPA